FSFPPPHPPKNHQSLRGPCPGSFFSPPPAPRLGRRPPRRPLPPTCVASALPRRGTSRPVEQDAPHHLRRYGKEVRAVLPIDVVDVDQLQVGFMHERRGLDRISRAFIPHETPGQASKLVINARRQPLERVLVFARPGAQKLSRFRTFGAGHVGIP